MELPITRCNLCGKAVKLTESIIGRGRTFCSEACQKEYLQTQLKQ